MIDSFEEYPDYIYTGFLIRFFAFLIDLMVIGSIQRLTLFLLDASLLKTLLDLFIYLLYFVLMTKLNDGQTLGKMVFGIKVVALHEKNLSWKTVLVREGFGRYLQKTIFILYTIAIFTPHKQHFVDLLTDTSVVTINFLRLLERN